MLPMRATDTGLAPVKLIVLTAVCFPLLVAFAGGCGNTSISRAQSIMSPQEHQPPAVSNPVPVLLFPQEELYGRYYFGDGLGVNCSLEISADHRFNYSWRGCMGVYDKNQGLRALEGDVLVLKPEKKNVTEGFRGMDVRFIPVKWGSRYFLVDENGMPGFCVTAAHEQPPVDPYGRESRLPGMDYLKVVDKPIKATGTGKPMPIIPQRYEEFREKGPVDAKVTRVDKTGRVTLNRGSADRVKIGMLMAIKSWANLDLEVLAVEQHTSVAKAYYASNSANRPKVGDLFSTGSGWNRPMSTGSQRFLTLPSVSSAKKDE